MKIFVVLPAYNESENLPRLLERFEQFKQQTRASENSFDLTIVLVDDGSSDATASCAEVFRERLQIEIERHPLNLGFGPALRTGLKKALALCQEGDLVVVMDADNSQLPELIPQMRKKISEGYDVVIASRYCAGGKVFGVPKLRELLSLVGSRFFQFAFPLKGVRDYTSSFRMMTGSILARLAEQSGKMFFKEDGFVCACEFLMNLAASGAKFAEVPLQLHYDQKKGASKMDLVPTIFGYFRLIIRMQAGG